MRGSLLCLDPDTNAYYQMLCCYTEVLWVVGFGGKLSWNVVFLWLNDMTFRRPKVRFTCATTWIRRDFAIHSFSRCKILLLIQPLFLTESLATVAVAILLLLISAMLLPVGGPSNEWRGVGGSTLNGMPEIFSYAPPGPFSFSRPELIIVWLKLLFS